MELKKINIDEIELDRTNPRIAEAVERYGTNLSAEKISQILSLDSSGSDDGNITTTFRELKNSIKTNKGIIHPIIVNETAKNKYVVIEGNTRWSIYKEFKNNNIEGDWSTIPSVVYKNMSDEQIDSIRLQSHLVGPRQWRPYNKAKYLHFLSNSQHLTDRQIVDYCGGNDREVSRFIEAYEMMESSYRSQIQEDSQFKPTKFSAFIEYVNPVKREAVINAGYTDNDFAKWVIDDKFPRLKLVRRLPEILENDESKNIFLNDDADEACRYLDSLSPNPDNNNLANTSIIELSKALINKIQTMPYDTFNQLKNNINGHDFLAVSTLKDLLNDFCNDIEQGNKNA